MSRQQPDPDLGRPARLEVHYRASRTVSRFLHSPAYLRILAGPRGEGKTTSGIYAWLWDADRYPAEALPIRVAVVRDTYENVLRTVVATLRCERDLRGLPMMGLEAAQPRSVTVAGKVELVLFGMDSLPDANKFQGLGIGGLWIDEPAPIADLSSGVPAEVLALGITSLRQPGITPRAILTMNPADEDHWTTTLPETLRAAAPQSGREGITIERFDIPPGENPYLPVGYRETSRQALVGIGRLDLVARLIEGRTGRVQVGEAVTPEYRDRQHVADKPFTWLPGEVESFRFWDFALNPTCVICQLTPRGILRVYASLILHNRGLEQLIKTVYLPWASRNRIPPYQRWRDIGDPAGATPEGSNSDRSCVETLYRLLRASFEPGPVDWPARRDSVRGVLTRLVDGQPLVQISPVPEAKPLRDALNGGWHYLRDASGRVREKPVKDRHSHPGDAFGYGCAVLFPELARALDDRRPRREGYPGWRAVRRMHEPSVPSGTWMSAGLVAALLVGGLGC